MTVGYYKNSEKPNTIKIFFYKFNVDAKINILLRETEYYINRIKNKDIYIGESFLSCQLMSKNYQNDIIVCFISISISGFLLLSGFSASIS